MEHDAEFLNYLYQNSQSGITAIEHLTKNVNDHTYKNEMNVQRSEYQNICQAAANQLHKRGLSEKKVFESVNIRPNISAVMNTYSNQSPANISVMMIRDSMLGIEDVTKNIEKYSKSDPEIKHLAEKLIKTEQKNIDNLKSYF